MKNVAFIGLGHMGMAIATRLVDAGFKLSLYNRSVQKLEPLRAKGAEVAGSIETAVKNADVVISCLFNDETVLNANNAILKAIKPDAMYVSTETILPKTAQTLSEKHAHHVTACSLGTPPVALNGELTVIFGGKTAQLKSLKPIFDTYTKKIIHAGDAPASANTLKIATNYLLCANIEAMSEAFAFADAEKLDKSLLHNMCNDIFAHPGFQLYAKRIANRDFDQVNFSLEGGLKDSSLFIKAFEESGINPLTVKATKTHIEAALKTELKDKDWSVLSEMCRVKEN